jgi:hypothetical protein
MRSMDERVATDLAAPQAGLSKRRSASAALFGRRGLRVWIARLLLLTLAGASGVWWSMRGFVC